MQQNIIENVRKETTAKKDSLTSHRPSVVYTLHKCEQPIKITASAALRHTDYVLLLSHIWFENVEVAVL